VSSDIKMILGGPGCGKTTRLLDIMANCIKEGIEPSRIAFVSFTKKAATEASDRACEKFNLDPDDLPLFSTIHSFCFKEAGMNPFQMMRSNDYIEVSKLLGVRISGYVDSVDVIAQNKGDRLLHLHRLAGALRKPLKEIWRDHGNGSNVRWWDLEWFSKSLTEWKRENGKFDFDDLLSLYIDNGDPIDVDIAIIDEAQDLSTLQWGVVRKAFKDTAQKIYIAGDDDQAIYRWNGADVDFFLNLKAEREILPHSFRLPKEIFESSQSIVKRIKKRYDKKITPSGHEGSVDYAPWSLNKYDLDNGSWFFLARTGTGVKDYEEQMKIAGYGFSTNYGSSVNPEHARAIYAWERLRKGESIPAEDIQHVADYMSNWEFRLGSGEFTLDQLRADYRLIGDGAWFTILTGIIPAQREYYRAVLRRGGNLRDTGRIYIGTIHSVKGGEADNVVLSMRMTPRTIKNLDKFPDDEHRVFFVGATRAKGKLWIDRRGLPGEYQIPKQH